MIIDIILDRKDGEQTGEKYDPRAFYRAILGWIDLNPKPAGEITAAMDYGTNSDVRAAARLFLSGNLIFECGEKPRTSAEFFDAMPYTSTSDFAAVWACNWSIINRKDKHLHFDGIALTDNTAAAVWTRYNENGDEIATEYEKI